MITALRRMVAIIRKEWWHILRDRQTLVIILIMPVAMMFLYGYALTLDLNEVPVLVEDPGRGQAAQEVVRRIDATTLFHVVAVIPPGSDPAELLTRHDAKALFRLPVDLDRSLRNGGRPATIQVLIDGSDQNTGTLIRNAVEPLVRNAVLDYLQIDFSPPLTIRSQFLYNPQQKSSLYFVPGLMAIILIMISALLTSLTVTREKETGTMEQLLVSPLRPVEIIAGKLVPYILLAAADGALILLAGRLLFGVQIQGSILFLAVASLVYIVTSLALGLIFSTVAKNQQQAMLMVLPVTLLPTIVLSGFIFPIRSMPLLLQGIAHIVPATWFLRLVRGIILKGVGIEALWVPLAVLCGIGLFFMLISTRAFKVKL